MHYPYYTQYQLLRTSIVARAIGLGEFSHNLTNLEINGGQILAQEKGTGNTQFLDLPATSLVGMGSAGGPKSKLVITPR